MIGEKDWSVYARQELGFLEDIVYLIQETKAFDFLSPEKHFYAAIINRAIKDYWQENVKYRDVSLMEDAWQWLFLESIDGLDDTYFFETEKEKKLAKYSTFENCCSVLNWNIDYIRDLIRKRKDGTFRYTESSL